MVNKKRVFFSCILLQLLFLTSIFAITSEPLTIKVGYTQIEGFLYKNENNELSGLAYDLFSELASLSNWNCEYIECTYSELQDYLDKGIIDIYFPYKKTPEREKQLEYSKAVFCKCEPTIHTSENRDIYYNDFEHMDNLVIGIPNQISDDKSIEEYLARHNCRCELKTDYNNKKELISALYRGEIDAFVSPTNKNLSLCRKIAALDVEDFYVVAKKGNNELLDTIDFSLEYIQNIKPFVITGLQEKYSISEENSYPPLNRREHELIQNKRRVNVLVNANECDSNGQFDKTSKSLFDKLTILTKLEFIPVVKQNNAELLEAMKNNEADTIYSFENNYKWADENNVLLTKPYITVEHLLVSKPNMANPKKIGVMNNSFDQKHSKYETQNLVSYNSYKEGFDLIRKGKIDCLYCPSPIGNFYSLSYKYKSLSYIPMFDNKVSYCLAVSKNSDDLLVHILNKAMLCVPDNYRFKPHSGLTAVSALKTMLGVVSSISN